MERVAWNNLFFDQPKVDIVCAAYVVEKGILATCKRMEKFTRDYADGIIDSREIPDKPDSFNEDYLKAPLPKDHKKRLQALWYNRLSRDVKPDLDKIVRTASEIFEVPYVLVNIVDDDHLHPYSTHNYPYGDLDRETSFCGHVILDPNRLLVIPNTDDDWRFQKNVNTTSDYHIRFYAGSPIKMQSPKKSEDDDPDSFAMGTLCLLDNKPRVLTPEEKRQLDCLAEMVQFIFDKHLYQSLIEDRNFMSKLLIEFIESADTSEDPVYLAQDILKKALRCQVVTVKKINPQATSVTVTVGDEKIDLPISVGHSKIWENDDYTKNAIIVSFSLQKTSDYYAIVAYTNDVERVFDVYDLNYTIQFGEALSASLQHELVVTANKAKTVFIESVSHELRTPLHGILSSADLLQESNTMIPSDKSLVSMIHSSGKNLINVINSLLDFHKWESESYHSISEPFNIFDLQQEVGDALIISLADDCRMFLQTDVSLEDHMIKADPGLMKQIVLNLVSNAVKFTTKGHVIIKMRRSEANLVWEISDTGKGMSKEFMEKELFSPFTKEDPFSQGVGLGLAISKHLCDASGGTLEVVSSEKNVGTVMRYTTPVHFEKTFGNREYQNTRWYYRTLLDTVITDNLGDFLQRYLDVGRQPGLTRKDKMILIDYIAHTDEEITEHVRKNVNVLNMIICKPDVVSIIPDEIVNGKNVAIITKPVGPLKLIEMMKKVDSQKQQIETRAKTFKILIVDDNAVNRNMLAMYCKKRKLQYSTATNGLEAFEKFKEEDYDIILMDIEMPICDGPTSVGMIRKYELERLHSQSVMRICTIVMLTGLGADDVKKRCMQMGANGYYVKPVSIKILDQIMESIGDNPF